MNNTPYSATKSPETFVEFQDYESGELYPSTSENSTSTIITEESTKIKELSPRHNDLSSTLGHFTKKRDLEIFEYDTQQFCYTKENLFFDFVPFPYLSPKIQSLLNKKNLTENQKKLLMESLAKQTINHFKPNEGDYLAINLQGQIISLAKTKIDLLKKIQQFPSSVQLFLWKVGSESFSGWI